MINNVNAYEISAGDLRCLTKVVKAEALEDVNQVFYAEGLSGAVSTAMDLSVRYVTADEYHKAVVGEDGASFEPRTLYVVSSDQLDAHNTQVVNVADPTDGYDAANKRYVDDQIERHGGGGGGGVSQAVYDI